MVKKFPSYAPPLGHRYTLTASGNTACLRLAVGFALVLETTNGVQERLVVVVPARIAVVVVHVPIVGVVAIIALASTPPFAEDADAADKAETATGEAATARQGRKSVLVRTVAVAVPTARLL